MKSPSVLMTFCTWWAERVAHIFKEPHGTIVKQLSPFGVAVATSKAIGSKIDPKASD